MKKPKRHTAALAALANDDFPALRLVRSKRTPARVAAALVMFFVIFAFALAFVPWQQSVVGDGRVIAYTPLERQQTIQAPLEGRIARWWVHEGARVAAGEKLLEIADNDPQLLARIDDELTATQDKLARAKDRAASVQDRIRSLAESKSLGTTAAQARVQMAADRRASAELALDAAHAADRAARLNLQRQDLLMKEGLASKRAHEVAEMEAAQRSAEVHRARAAVSAADNELLALKADQGKVGTDIVAIIESSRADYAKAMEDMAHSEGDLIRLSVRRSRQHSQVVVAPRAGTVLRQLVGESAEMVKAGDPLLILVPDTGQRAVEMWVDGNDAPLISAGRHVRLQFEGWPAIQFSGWPSVAVGTFGGTVSFVDATDNGDGDFRIVVSPDGAEPWPDVRYLRQGVHAKGWVLLNRVRAGFELWRNWNGFPPTLPRGTEQGQLSKKKDRPTAGKAAGGEPVKSKDSP